MLPHPDLIAELLSFLPQLFQLAHCPSVLRWGPTLLQIPAGLGKHTCLRTHTHTRTHPRARAQPTHLHAPTQSTSCHLEDTDIETLRL